MINARDGAPGVGNLYVSASNPTILQSYYISPSCLGHGLSGHFGRAYGVSPRIVPLI